MSVDEHGEIIIYQAEDGLAKIDAINMDYDVKSMKRKIVLS